METINISATNCTPEVYLGEDAKLVIRGRSLPENAAKFYQPIIDQAEKFTMASLMIEINMEYMNSASSKKILHLLKILDANNNIKELTINWIYETGDEDTLEHGQIYEELLLKAHFRYHECAENS